MSPDLKSLLWLVRAEIALFLLAAGGIVLGGLLTGAINTRGLLRAKGIRDRGISPTRIQLLLANLAATYVAVSTMLHGNGGATLPDVPSALVLGFTGSNSVYLVRKVFASGLGSQLRKRL